MGKNLFERPNYSKADLALIGNRSRMANAGSDYKRAVSTFGFDSGEAMAAWLHLRSQPGRFRPLFNLSWAKSRPA